MIQRRKGVNGAGRKRAVIFDFDGTIADSFDYVFAFLRGEAKNTDSFTAAQQRELRKMSMRRLALHLGVPLWRLPAVYFKGRRVMRTRMGQVQAFEGILDAIHQLHETGYQLFISSSNSTKNIRQFLERYDISSCFRAVQGGAGFAGKTMNVRYLLRRYHLPKEATWYVGDEIGDVVSANAAGIQCLTVAWGFADPDMLSQLQPELFVRRASDIPVILEQAWKK